MPELLAKLQENLTGRYVIERELGRGASDLTPAYLRIDPTFKPLYGNPRFERLAGKAPPP